MSAGMLTEVGSLRRPAGKGFALKVQDKACNDVAGLAAAGSSLDRRSAVVRAIAAMQNNARATAPIVARGPSCVSPTPELKRE